MSRLPVDWSGQFEPRKPAWGQFTNYPKPSTDLSTTIWKSESDSECTTFCSQASQDVNVDCGVTLDFSWQALATHICWINMALELTRNENAWVFRFPSINMAYNHINIVKLSHPLLVFFKGGNPMLFSVLSHSFINSCTIQTMGQISSMSGPNPRLSLANASAAGGHMYCLAIQWAHWRGGCHEYCRTGTTAEGGGFDMAELHGLVLFVKGVWVVIVVVVYLGWLF